MATVRVSVTATGEAELRRIVDTEVVWPITDEVAADMRRMVPVLSGDLRDTIEPEYSPGVGRVFFGGGPKNVDYHLYQEFGTSRMAAQPYARPALYRARSV